MTVAWPKDEDGNGNENEDDSQGAYESLAHFNRLKVDFNFI